MRIALTILLSLMILGSLKKEGRDKGYYTGVFAVLCAIGIVQLWQKPNHR